MNAAVERGDIVLLDALTTVGRVCAHTAHGDMDAR